MKFKVSVSLSRRALSPTGNPTESTNDKKAQGGRIAWLPGMIPSRHAWFT